MSCIDKINSQWDKSGVPWERPMSSTGPLLAVDEDKFAHTQQIMDVWQISQKSDGRTHGNDRTMQIFIKTLSDDTLTLDVEPTELVDSIKSKIFNEEGIPSECQLLLYADKDLEGGRRLCDYKVENLSTIHLTLRMVGGSYIDGKSRELVYMHTLYKMICRKCYGRLPPRATRCRKVKCGRTTNIRKKKLFYGDWPVDLFRQLKL